MGCWSMMPLVSRSGAHIGIPLSSWSCERCCHQVALDLAPSKVDPPTKAAAANNDLDGALDCL